MDAETLQEAENHQPGPPGKIDEPWCQSCGDRWPCLVHQLVVEVRRLRAEVDGLKHTRTVGTAPVIGPEAVRYRFEGPAPLLPYPED